MRLYGEYVFSHGDRFVSQFLRPIAALLNVHSIISASRLYSRPSILLSMFYEIRNGLVDLFFVCFGGLKTTDKFVKSAICFGPFARARVKTYAGQNRAGSGKSISPCFPL